MNQVIGNKSDTVAGTSLVSIGKKVYAEVTAPIADVATDATIAQVVGRKADTIAGNSLVSLVKINAAKLDAIDDYIDTEVASIKAKTDGLPADTATALTSIETKIDTIDDFIDTEIAAIKTKTDNLPANTATELSTLTSELAKVPKSDSNVTFNATALASILTQVNSATGVGTEFWIKKTVTSSAILEASSVDITGVSSVGELAITDVILKTDSTGLATGTNFELLTDNTKGIVNILVETVANLGANTTVTLLDASVTKKPTVLEVGKKIQVHSTVAACTGAGTIDIYIKFQRLTTGATIAAL
jgi:hypothetical protein